MTEACIAKNELHRHGSYSPSQWVLGKMPSTPPSALSEQSWADLGAIEDQCDPESKFTLVHEATAAAKRAYVHLDCSKKVRRRDNQKGPVWSPAIGKEGEDKIWVLCNGIPVLASPQNMRPAQDAEALAFSFLNDENQGFEDATSTLPEVPEPSQLPVPVQASDEEMGPDGDNLGTLLGDTPTIPGREHLR